MGSEKQTVSKNGGRHLKLNIGLIVFIGIFIYLIAIGLSYLMRNHISFYEVQQDGLLTVIPLQALFFVMRQL